MKDEGRRMNGERARRRRGVVPPLLAIFLCIHPSSFILRPSLSAEPSSAILIGDSPRPAELLSVTEKGIVQLRVEGQTREVPLASLIGWGAFRSPVASPQIVLADGGLLVADVLGLKDDLLKVDAPVAGAGGIAIERVAGILYHPPGDTLRRDRLAEQLSARNGDTDRLILENGDELDGTILALTESSLELRRPGGAINVPLERVAALRFNPQLVERPKPRGSRVLVGLSDGSRLVASPLSLNESEAALDAGDDLVWRVPRSEVASQTTP